MGLDHLANLTGSRKTIRTALLTIILLTLPCYCLGAVLLATAPESEATRSTGTQPPTLGGITSSPTVTPFSIFTPTARNDPLRATSTQLFLYPTVPQIVWPTWTLTFTPQPTWTPLPQPTVAPTITVPPSATLPPTAIPVPTDVPIPTDTPLPTVSPLPTTEPGGLEATPTQDSF